MLSPNCCCATTFAFVIELADKCRYSCFERLHSNCTRLVLYLQSVESLQFSKSSPWNVSNSVEPQVSAMIKKQHSVRLDPRLSSVCHSMKYRFSVNYVHSEWMCCTSTLVETTCKFPPAFGKCSANKKRTTP